MKNQTIILIICIFSFVLASCGTSVANTLSETSVSIATLPPTLTPLTHSSPTVSPPLAIATVEPFSSDANTIEQAKDVIPLNRQGDITIRLQNEKGQPLSSYLITYEQTSHQFEFMAFDDPPSEFQKLQPLGFNGMHLNIWWTLFEPEDGKFRPDFVNGYRNIEELHAAGLTLKAQDIFCMSEDSQSTPDYLYVDSFEELQEKLKRHLTMLTKRFASSIDRWEAILEPDLIYHNPFNLSKEQYLALIATSVDTIRTYDPDALIEINFSEPCQSRKKNMLIDILDAGIDFDIVGLQYYYNAHTIHQMNYQPPQLSLSEISACLDDYQEIAASYNKHLAGSEVAVPATSLGNESGYWGKQWNEDLQAQYLTSIYTIFFSKKLNTSINYWDAVEPSSFIYEAGLIDKNGQQRKAYWALKELLNSWMTSGEGITKDGQFSLRGFGGDYQAIITDPNTGAQMTANFNILEQKIQEISIIFVPDADIIDKRSVLQRLVGYWELQSNSALIQKGQDYLSLADHHLAAGERKFALQTLDAGLDELAITTKMHIQPNQMKGYLDTNKIIWLENGNVLLWPSGTAYFKYHMPPGQVQMIIRVRGTSIDGKYPTMILGIGDKYSERIVVSSTVTPYTFNATTTGNEQIITARFLYEDSSNPGEWKLFIDGIDLEIKTTEIPKN